jgi:cyclopropane-fatty-acyl-phospholipid synthase
MLFASLLRTIIRSGSVKLVDAAGRSHLVGDRTAPTITVRIATRRLDWRLAFNPMLAIGEAYMEGGLTTESGTIYDFLALLARNYGTLGTNAWLTALEKLSAGLKQRNPLARSRKNVVHHYDLSGELYDLFLDSERQYSCAYFASPEDSLDDAQQRKMRHLASKLLLGKPGLKVLDIGSGWGGLALYLASECGADVTGLTLSTEQLKVAQRRAAQAGLSDRVRFMLRDYREEKEQYDRIVSVGMFEHVGVGQYPAFFQQVKALLKPDGVALLHSIGRMDGPGSTNPWIRKYIFPGGYSPAISEVMTVIERTRLWVTDIEVLRLHYAETLKAWRRRFLQQRDKVLELYDERFYRMWETYLIGSEIAFRHGGHLVMQIQMTKTAYAVPFTRDYMFEWERSHREADDRAA